MIVDGICIQFLGCFDCNQDHSNIQQINGVGRVQLDEDYYRELSSTQVISFSHEIFFFNGSIFRFSPMKSKSKRKKGRKYSSLFFFL